MSVVSLPGGMPERLETDVNRTLEPCTLNPEPWIRLVDQTNKAQGFSGLSIFLSAAHGRLKKRDWYLIAEQTAPAPHLAHPERCAAYALCSRVTMPLVSRSCEHKQCIASIEHSFGGMRTGVSRKQGRAPPL